MHAETCNSQQRHPIHDPIGVKDGVGADVNHKLRWIRLPQARLPMALDTGVQHPRKQDIPSSDM